MDLLAGDDLRHGVERSQDAILAVILERGVAHLGPRIAPGDREDGEALPDEIVDERVLRPEIEDVVFHDPGRDDQHRLGMDGFGLRLVLQKLEQVVAEDDLAGGAGQGLADDVGAVEIGPGAAQRGGDVDGQHRGAVHQVRTGGVARRLDHLGVEEGEVRGREGVEHLPGHEGDAVGIAAVGAAHRLGRLVPPVMRGKEALLHQVEGVLPPAFVVEAMVGLARPEGRFLARHRPPQREIEKLPGIALRPFGEFDLPPRRDGKMGGPVRPGLERRIGGDAAGHPRQGGARGAVQRVAAERGLGNRGGQGRLRRSPLGRGDGGRGSGGCFRHHILGLWSGPLSGARTASALTCIKWVAPRGVTMAGGRKARRPPVSRRPFESGSSADQPWRALKRRCVLLMT